MSLWLVIFTPPLDAEHTNGNERSRNEYGGSNDQSLSIH